MPGTRGHIVYDFGKLCFDSASIQQLVYFFLVNHGWSHNCNVSSQRSYTVLFNVKSIMIQILHITTNSNLYYNAYFAFLDNNRGIIPSLCRNRQLQRDLITHRTTINGIIIFTATTQTCIAVRIAQSGNFVYS